MPMLPQFKFLNREAQLSRSRYPSERLTGKSRAKGTGMGSKLSRPKKIQVQASDQEQEEQQEQQEGGEGRDQPLAGSALAESETGTFAPLPEGQRADGPAVRAQDEIEHGRSTAELNPTSGLRSGDRSPTPGPALVRTILDSDRDNEIEDGAGGPQEEETGEREDFSPVDQGLAPCGPALPPPSPPQPSVPDVHPLPPILLKKRTIAREQPGDEQESENLKRFRRLAFISMAAAKAVLRLPF